MDYFQGVVTEFLRADRAVFLNTQYLIQLEPGDAYVKDRHWYCDVVAINHRTSTVELCEITYSSTLQSLIGRLRAWEIHWMGITEAIKRDSSLSGSWAFQPHVFIPDKTHDLLKRKIGSPDADAEYLQGMPFPKITPLESILPWKYRSWNGKPYDDL